MATEYFNILRQVVASLRAANIPGNPGVSARRKPLLLPADTIPRIIVWPGKGGEREAAKQFRGASTGKVGVWWSYPVNVAFIVAGNREVEAGLESYLDERQSIRDALYAMGPADPAGGVPGVFDIQPFEPEEVFDLEAFLKGNYDVTGFEVDYLSAESLNIQG